MKTKLILALIVLFVSNSFGQQKILPYPPNLNSKLIHTFAVVGPKSQKYNARKLGNSAYELTIFEQLNMDLVPTLEDLPDVVFVINDSTDQARELIARVIESGAILIELMPNDMRSPIRNVSDIGAEPSKLASYENQLEFISAVLRFIYHSGMRPTYNTVFGAQGDGYAAFVSPTVIRTSDGTLVAFAQASKNELDGLQPSDIVMKRSTDGGVTWSALTKLASTGKNTLTNPTAIYAPDKNRIVLLFQQVPEIGADGKPKNTGVGFMQTYSCISSDNGKTWSTPTDITQQVKQPRVPSYGSGPGVGICVKGGTNNGRLIVPFYSNSSAYWFNYLVYSDDSGDSWKVARGNSAYGINESQIVQISHDEFLINASSYRVKDDNNFYAPSGWNPYNYENITRNRAQLTVRMVDSVAVWSSPKVMVEQHDPTCQGSLIRFNPPQQGGDSILLMSNPASQHSWSATKEPYSSIQPMRVNGSVKISFDNGKTWPLSNRIFGDRFTAFQNSVLVRLDGEKIGCIFDNNRNIQFAIFDINWLKGEKARKKIYNDYYDTVR